MLTTSIAYQYFCFSTLDDEKLSADIALGDDRLPRPDGRVEVDNFLNVPSVEASKGFFKRRGYYLQIHYIDKTYIYIYICIQHVFIYPCIDILYIWLVVKMLVPGLGPNTSFPLGPAS